MAEFEEQLRGTIAVLRVAGEIDMATADDFRDRLLECLGRSHSLEVDLGGVTFMDSSGIAALVRLRTDAEIAGKHAALVNVSRSTARILELTGLQGLLGADLPRT